MKIYEKNQIVYTDKNTKVTSYACEYSVISLLITSKNSVYKYRGFCDFIGLHRH